MFKLYLENAEEPEIKRRGTLKEKQNNPQDKKCYNQGENKELIPRTCKQPMLFNRKSRRGQRSKRIFLPRRHPGGYKAHEQMLTSLIIKEIKIKTTRTYYLTQLRMAYVLTFTNKMAERTRKHRNAPALMLATWAVSSQGGGQGEASLNKGEGKEFTLSLTAYRRKNPNCLKMKWTEDYSHPLEGNIGKHTLTWITTRSFWIYG